MARLPRLNIPGQPHHVIQRGNNRQPIVTGDADRQLLLELLGAASRECGVTVHAYCVLDTQFHLLVTAKDERGLPALMQSLGRRYVQRFNRTHGRTGTLWDGRYRATVLQAETYLVPCMVAIDRAPVAAGLVAAPADHPWSSHRHYVGLSADRLVTPHPVVWALGNTPFAREQAYAELVAAGLPDAVNAKLTAATEHGWALGEPDHLASLSQRTSRPLAPRAPGRPKRLNLSPN